MVDTDARRLLAALASTTPPDGSEDRVTTTATDYRNPIDRAIDATEDLDAATAFLADNDLAELEAAIERAHRDLSSRAEEGRAALERLREFRRAALK